MSENPYEAPQPEDSASPPDHIVGSSEEIRSMHLKHEAAVRSIGLLYCIGGGLPLMIVPLMLLDRNITSRNVEDAIAIALIAAVPLTVGAGLRRLRAWGKVGGIILGAIGLLLFPVGTVISGYTIYLLMCAKGSTIFSSEYKEIIAATPQMKPRTSVIIWILIVISASLFSLLLHLSH